jgi:Tol biopolymer transport system component
MKESIMHFRPFSVIGILCVFSVLVLSVGSAAPDFSCIEIGKYTSTGILNTVTGEYAEYPGLKTAWYTSPNGQYTLHLASTADSSEITVRSNTINQARMTVAGITPPIYLQEGRWSPDSHQIAFVSSYHAAGVPPESRLTVVDIPTGTMKIHSFDKISYGDLGYWSADGDYLYFTLSSDIDHHALYFLAADSGNAISFPVVWSEIMAQRWDPSGHRLTLVRETANQQDLLLIEPEQGIVSSIDMPLHVSDPKILYSPEGNYLAVYGYINCDQDGHNCDTGTVIFSSDGTSPQVITGSIYGVPEWQAVWSGDDSVWLSLRPAQSPPDLVLSDAWEYKDLAAYHLADGRSEVVQANTIVPNYLTRLPASYYGASASYFSPDGKHMFMVYADQGKINVVLADAEGQNRRLVIEQADGLAVYNGLTTYYPCTACQAIGISLSNPTWIGNRLLVKWQTKENTRLTWIDADGSARQDLPDADSIENITVLPGDRYMVYGDTRSQELVMLDLETGQHKPVYQPAAGQMAEIPPWYAVMSPDHLRTIVVVGGTINKQYLVTFKDFNAHEIGPGSTFLAGPTWSPDGRSIAFLESDPDHISVRIVSPTHDEFHEFGAGYADFWFPREFISRERVMAWMECS